ncbi:hypothetical protein, partial [Faecalibaculum rodentium]
FITLVIDPKVALLKGVDPVQFCVFFFAVRNKLRQSDSRRCGNPCSCDTANSGTAGIRKAFRLPQVVHLEQKSGRTARVLS